MSRRNRDRRPARRAAFRDPRPRILIVCEGEVTEPEYFTGLSAWCKNPRVRIQLEPGAGDPRRIVDRAKKLKQNAQSEAKREKDENLLFEEVWAVFDVDDHLHLQDARQNARDAQIELAISNPCFELWLLLHFRDSPGMQHRDHIASMLRGFLREYHKSVAFQLVSHGYNLAVARAQRLEVAAIDADEGGRNPSTGVWRLTELIRGDSIVS